MINSETKDQVKVAVIGVGSMGRNHARVYSELPSASLVGVADVDLSLAESVASNYASRAYASYQHMLEAERPDAVSIAVPTADHEQVALDALEAGCHLLIEKPITSTVAQGQGLVDKARALDRKLMVGHIVRFNPAIQELKRRLRNDELGRIFQVVCRRVGPFPPRIRDVGVVVDLASHDLDLMRYLLEMEPLRVYAEIERRIHTQHEDLLLALLRFPSGVSGSLEINWLTPLKVREVWLLGERGMYRVDDLTQDIYFYENAAVNGEFWSALRTLKGVSEGAMTRYPLQRYEPLKAELDSFIQAVVDDTPVPVSGEEGLASLRIALALVESGRSNQVVTFDDANGFANHG